MTEPTSSDPWSSLADSLGVEPTAEKPSSAPSPPVSEPPKRAKAAPAPKPRPSTNWREIAGELGVDVPPEPEPPAQPSQAPPAESLVRGEAAPMARGGAERPGEERSADRAAGRGRGGEESRDRETRRGRDQERGRGGRGDRGRGSEQRGRHGERGGRRGHDERGRGALPQGQQPKRQSRDTDDTDRAARQRPSYANENEREYLDRDFPENAEQAFDSLADEQAPPMDEPPFELQDSPMQEAESRLERDEFGDDRDFGDEQPGVQEPQGREEPATRRRRRRRGHRGVMREDAFLGIERLATDDIADRNRGAESPSESFGVDDRRELDRSEDDDDAASEEITALELDRGEAITPSDSQEKELASRRHRRRRGRRSKGHARESMQDETGKERRETRAAVHGDFAPDDDESEGFDEDESGAMEAGERPSKSLHREVTPWKEAIGFIVAANLEARARSPGGGQRGRWDRRS